MFDTIQQTDPSDGAKHFMSFVFSMFAHVAGVCVLAILPLVFMKAVQQADFVTFFAMGPPPRLLLTPAVPPSGSGRKGPVAQQGNITKINYYLAPRLKPIGVVPEAPAFEEIQNTGLPGGTPGGPGDGPGGGIGVGPIAAFTDMITMNKSIKPPELKNPVPRPKIKVGGDIMASKLIRKVDPLYPRIAQITRVSGTVELEAVIDEEGNVTEPKILSGNELFNKAALDAVKQWKYSPTILNGEPIQIVTMIKVIFRIQR